MGATTSLVTHSSSVGAMGYQLDNCNLQISQRSTCEATHGIPHLLVLCIAMRRCNPYRDTMAQDTNETPHVRLSGWDCQTKLLNAACSVGECVEADKSQEFSEQQVIGASMTVSRWQQPHKGGHVTGRPNAFTHPNTITQACCEAEAHPPYSQTRDREFHGIQGEAASSSFLPLADATSMCLARWACWRPCIAFCSTNHGHYVTKFYGAGIGSKKTNYVIRPFFFAGYLHHLALTMNLN